MFMIKSWRLTYLYFIEVFFTIDISLSNEYKAYEKCYFCKGLLEFLL